MLKKLIVVDAKGHLLVQNIMVVQIDKYRRYKSNVIIYQVNLKLFLGFFVLLVLEAFCYSCSYTS